MPISKKHVMLLRGYHINYPIAYSMLSLNFFNTVLARFIGYDGPKKEHSYAGTEMIGNLRAEGRRFSMQPQLEETDGCISKSRYKRIPIVCLGEDRNQRGYMPRMKYYPFPDYTLYRYQIPAVDGAIRVANFVASAGIARLIINGEKRLHLPAVTAPYFKALSLLT